MQKIASIFTYYYRSPDRSIALGRNVYASSLAADPRTVDLD
jgi:hypothetical protein